jgi:hypothetical protein
MIKNERNIANIFFPFSNKALDKDMQEGLLVGFNFEGFLFVIVSVIRLDKIPLDKDRPNET